MEITSLQRLTSLSLSHGGIPDKMVILNFRHLLELHQLGKQLFDEVTTYLGQHGLMLREGTILMQALLKPRARRKTETASVIQKFTSLARESNGTLG